MALFEHIGLFEQEAVSGESPLTNAHIWVGDSNNIAQDVAVSGDATMANTGALTVVSIGGKTASTTSAANTIVVRDANSNAFANVFTNATTNVVSAGGTTVLTAASSRKQQLTGTLAQTFQLPDATTLTVGSEWFFNNNSTGLLTVTNAGGSALFTVATGGAGIALAIAVVVPNGAWDIHYLEASTFQATTVANTGSAYTIDPANGTVFNLTITANTTLTLQTTTAIKTRVIYANLTMGGTGSYTVTWANVQWQENIPPTIPTAIGTTTYVRLICDGAVWRGSVESRGTGIGRSVLQEGATLINPAVAGSSTGVNIITTANASSNNYINIVPAQSGTFALTNAAQTFTAPQRSSVSALTDAATITPDFSLANDYSVVLGGNRTLGIPSNMPVNTIQKGSISVRQDITGSRTLAYAWCYMFPAGTAPVLTTTKAGFDQLYYQLNGYNTSTVTVTIATPAVMTWTAHGLVTGQKIQLTTTGALPTGLAANTSYWVTVINANTFNLSTSLANVGTATFIATSGSQSGVHTAVQCSITLTSNLALA